MGQAKRRREAIARGEPDPGADREYRRCARVREKNGKLVVSVFGQEREIAGPGLRAGDRIVITVPKERTS